VRFGLIPEFIGRMPSIAVLDPLDEETLIDILVRPKNAITKQFQKLFSYEGVNLKFTEAAVRAIAQLSLKRKTGARGLRAVLENALLDLMYDLPSQKEAREVLIDEDFFTKKAPPKIIKREEGFGSGGLSDVSEGGQDIA
jgi:ATP-dependent Clp protease ATP-binding subunit ClpX